MALPTNPVEGQFYIDDETEGFYLFQNGVWVFKFFGGASGDVGPVGPAGPVGPPGASGTDGTDGEAGPIGPAGPAGTNGTDGAPGTNGTDGVPGAPGSPGPAGPVGADGTDGTDGAQGTPGPQGPVGPAGADGTAGGGPGIPGPQGPEGDPGADGNPGPPGDKGPTGDPGAVNGVSVNKAGAEQALVVLVPTKVSWPTTVYDYGTHFASDKWTPPAGVVELTTQASFVYAPFDQSTNSVALDSSGSTIVDESRALQNDTTIYALRMFSSAAVSGCQLGIAHSAGGDYDFLAAQTFNHPGGGFFSVPLDTPFSVPASGVYYIASYYPSDLGTAPAGGAISVATAPGLMTIASGVSGFTESTSATTAPATGYLLYAGGLELAIYKNGTAFATDRRGPSGLIATLAVDAQDRASGTDYYEVYATAASGAYGLSGRTDDTYFSGRMTGTLGDKGLDGDKGPTGDKGATGDKGLIGDQGPVGNRGPDGSPGSDGADGEQGPPGSQGLIGPVGPIGPIGPIGLTGPKGNDGSDGEDGLPGMPGMPGAAGAAGAAGAQGPIGLTGALGPMGYDGGDGEQGQPGPAGAVGPQGIPGVQGPQGIPGSDGAEGAEGERGPPGTAGAAAATAPSALCLAVNMQAGQQNGSAGTWTKANLTSIQVDTQGAFDATTNFRFTPKQAGLYLFKGVVYCPAASSGNLGVNVRKNGQPTTGYVLGTLTQGFLAVTDALFMNGSTDYVELWGFNGDNGTPVFYGHTVTSGTVQYDFTAALLNVGAQGPTGATGAQGPAGPAGIPQNVQNVNYTCVLADANGQILHNTGSSNTHTIPANSVVPYDIGTTLTFVSLGGVLSIAINTDTMYLGGGTSTGTRTLGVVGIATALKIGAGIWVISGAGLT